MTWNDDGSWGKNEYDGLGRVTRIQQSSGDQTQNWYDAVGNVIETLRTDVATTSTTNNETFTTTMFYDSLGGC
jgi:YD repeat-containing protein